MSAAVLTLDAVQRTEGTHGVPPLQDSGRAAEGRRRRPAGGCVSLAGNVWNRRLLGVFTEMQQDSCRGGRRWRGVEIEVADFLGPCLGRILDSFGYCTPAQRSPVGRWTQPGCVVLVKIASLKAVSFESVPASYIHAPGVGFFRVGSSRFGEEVGLVIGLEMNLQWRKLRSSIRTWFG